MAPAQIRTYHRCKIILNSFSLETIIINEYNIYFNQYIFFRKRKMTSHGIRGSTLTSIRSNVENEAGHIGLRGKAGNTMDMAKGRVTRTRAAMTDIGNKAGILQNANKNVPTKGII